MHRYRDDSLVIGFATIGKNSIVRFSSFCFPTSLYEHVKNQFFFQLSIRVGQKYDESVSNFPSTFQSPTSTKRERARKKRQIQTFSIWKINWPQTKSHIRGHECETDERIIHTHTQKHQKKAHDQKMYQFRAQKCCWFNKNSHQNCEIDQIKLDFLGLVNRKLERFAKFKIHNNKI